MQESEIDLGGIYRFLLRQKRLILATMAIVIALAAAIAFALTPIYRATTLVVVDTTLRDALTDDPRGPAVFDNARIDGEAELAGSDHVLLGVVEQQKLAADPEFGPRPPLWAAILSGFHQPGYMPPPQDAAEQQALAALRAATQVERRSLTNLLSVTVAAQSPEKAARLANAVADAYIAEQVSSKIAATLQVLDMVSARLQQAQDAMDSADVGASGPTTEAGLFRFQQQSELARQQYQSLLTRARQLDAEVDLQLPDARVAARALAPQYPAFPNKTLILALAIIGSAGLGVALAILREQLIGGFTSDEQVTSVLRLPVAAVVPRLLAAFETESLADHVVTSPVSPFSEAVRRCRAATDQALRRSQAGSAIRSGKVILITSAEPGEGKTTMALAMARSYAMSGLKVLLIDCDLRKPSLHHHLNLEPNASLTDMLRDGDRALDRLRTSLVSDPLGQTSVILGAHQPHAPTDQLFDGPGFAQLLDAARHAFDVIILDTPPVGPVVDALYVARHADAVIFAVKWATTSQSQARRHIAAMAEAKREQAPVLVVLSQQDAPSSREAPGYAAQQSFA